MLTDIIVTIILVLILGGAIFYIVKSKKSGKRCIGCPDSGSCSKSNNTSCSGSCSCCCSNQINEK